MSDSISKRKFWRYVNLKINRMVNRYHVFSIINILFDEMLEDLKDGKEIKIYNFGRLLLKQMPARQYFNVWEQKFMPTKGNKIMRFFLVDKIRKKICSALTIN